MIRLMDMVHIFILMEPSMKVIGGKISKMVKVKRRGLMEPVIKVITNRERNLVMVNLNGQMDQSMKDSSLKIIFMEKVYWS